MAGTVVPPGRLIPTKQLWGGNPCTFIKDLDVAETWANYTFSYVNHYLSEVHKKEFTVWNSAYLDKEPYYDDYHPEDFEMDSQRLSLNVDRGMIKYYA